VLHLGLSTLDQPEQPTAEPLEMLAPLMARRRLAGWSTGGPAGGPSMLVTLLGVSDHLVTAASCAKVQQLFSCHSARH